MESKDSEMEVDKQDKKRKKADISSDLDTSCQDNDLSYLDLDTKQVVKMPSSTPRQGSFESESVPIKTYDKLMGKITAMEKCMSKLGKLDKLDKLDNMERAVRQIELKMDKFDKRMQKTEETVMNMEKSVDFVNQQYDTIDKERRSDKAQLKTINNKVDEVKKENDELKQMLFDMRRLNNELKEEMLDIKSRSMRDNLLFTNIHETGENEDTEQVLKNFLKDKMGITELQFERVHRLQNRQFRYGQNGKPRAIIAKFTFFKDRERVRKSGRLLKGTQFGIHEQYPVEIEKRRKPLYPLLRQARKDRKKAVIVKDRLFVDGREVFAKSEDKRKSETEQSSGLASVEGATGGTDRGSQ